MIIYIYIYMWFRGSLCAGVCADSGCVSVSVSVSWSLSVSLPLSVSLSLCLFAAVCILSFFLPLPFPYSFLLKTIKKSLPGAPDPPPYLFLISSY